MLWPATAQKYGVTDPYDPAQNIRAGCLHWQEELARMRNKLPILFPSRGYEYMACGQLYTMIGGGATPYLLKTAGVRPGSEYSDLVNWVKAQGEQLEAHRSKFGTQSAASVARRVMYAGFMTDVANEIGGVGKGLTMIGLAVVALAGYFMWKFWK
jgi:hypothetical protein